jgi:hypothetical protein
MTDEDVDSFLFFDLRNRSLPHAPRGAEPLEDLRAIPTIASFPSVAPEGG